MIIDKTINIKITKNISKYYIGKGYDVNIGDFADINVNDLSPHSHNTVRVQCDYCGNEYTATYKNILKGRTTISKDSCKQCVGYKCAEITIERRKESHFQRLIDKCNENGYELLSDKDAIVNNKTYIKYRCPKHGVHEMRIANFLSGKKCPECASDIAQIKYSRSQKDIIDRISECGGIVINPEDYINGCERNLKIICPECKNVFITSYILFTQHGGQVCPDCSTSAESIGEKKVRFYLEKNNIKFKQNYWFDDCRDIHPLPFDFYLPDQNKIIEFDGRQHYGSTTFFHHSQEMTPIHDKMKNEYCKNKGIDLLRIPYWNINKVDEILSKFVS